MTKLSDFKKHLRPGQVYRRKYLARWSSAIDRHLQQLVREGMLTKLAGGLYLCPPAFGRPLPNDNALVKSFLNDRFLMASPNVYNTLGVDTTGLYVNTVVYNRKRHCNLSLGGHMFHFRRKLSLPKKLSREFLLVDLINNSASLAVSKEKMLARVKADVAFYDAWHLQRAARDYGNTSTKTFFAQILRSGDADGQSRRQGARGDPVQRAP
jgi:hypothetical protein